MLFKQDILQCIGAGEVTLAFRRWKRPTVKAGGSLRAAVGVLAIERVEPVDPARITVAEAHRAGFHLANLKRRVRRLKALGLTESLTAGYRLSPRGQALGRKLSDGSAANGNNS